MKTITNIDKRYNSPERNLIVETPFVKKIIRSVSKHNNTNNSEGNRFKNRLEFASGESSAKKGNEKVKYLISPKPKSTEINAANHVGHACGLQLGSFKKKATGIAHTTNKKYNFLRLTRNV